MNPARSPPLQPAPSRHERGRGTSHVDPLQEGGSGHRRLALAVGVALPIFTLFALLNGLLHDAPRMAATSAAAAVLAALSWWMVNRAGRPRLGGHLFVLAFSVQVLGEMAVNGGLQAPATPLAVLIVPAALLLIGLAAGRAWTVIVLIGLFALATLDLTGQLPRNEMAVDSQAMDRALSLLAGVAVSLLVVGGFERQTRDSLARVEDERARWLHEATHDSLTGLPNRMLFRRDADERIARAVATGRPCTIFYLDINRFKEVNDTRGHAIGDCLLVAFAERLRHRLRPGDQAARLSGDEFVVLADDCDEAAATAILHGRLLAITADPFELPGERIVMTMSIGFATSGIHGTALDELMREADHAMYRCKGALQMRAAADAG
jgi:diguanylate cyclase (GGDEF)-like protein